MTLGRSTLGRNTLGRSSGEVPGDLDVDFDVEGELTVEAVDSGDLEVAFTVRGLIDIQTPPAFARPPGGAYVADLDVVDVHRFSKAGLIRIELVDNVGVASASAENALFSGAGLPLNDFESWGFSIDTADPKFRAIMDERFQEAQLWIGSLLVSWGPIVRPRVTSGRTTVQVRGTDWYLSRRHVGKANRDNRLINPSFERGLAGWTFLKSAYFLDFQRVNPPDARIYGPGIDGGRALELNADIKPWETPGGIVGAGDSSYTVVSGDTLWALAKGYYGSGTQWWRIYDANAAQIKADAQAAGLWDPNDPGHWIFPGQVFTIPGVPADEAEAAPDDDADLWGGVEAFQDIAVSGGERGVVATMAGWCRLPSDEFDGYNPDRAGFLLTRLPANYRTATTLPGWGGYRGLYDQVIEARYARVDERTPFDEWVRIEVSTTIPPGESEILHASCLAPDGRIYFDDLSVTFDDAFEQFNVDQAIIVRELVEHAQDPAFGKGPLEIRTATPRTGVKRTLVSLHSDARNIWSHIQEFTQYRQGLDVSMAYTETTRTLRTHFPERGQERPRAELAQGRNIESWEWTFDGEAAASQIRMLGTGSGSDREEASATDLTAFANDLLLETVEVVGEETPVQWLPEIAAEHLAVATDPAALRITTLPFDPSVPGKALLGRVWPGDFVPVTIRAGLQEDGSWNFTVSGWWRVVDVQILADLRLVLTLNPREAA